MGSGVRRSTELRRFNRRCVVLGRKGISICGVLKHENRNLILKGALTEIHDQETGKDFKGFWSNHARQETLDKWTSAGWKEGQLSSIKSYTEGYGPQQKEFDVPQGKAIKIIYHPGISTPGGGVPFQIVTRDAVGEVEVSTHPRFPVLVDK